MYVSEAVSFAIVNVANSWKSTDDKQHRNVANDNGWNRHKQHRPCQRRQHAHQNKPANQGNKAEHEEQGWVNAVDDRSTSTVGRTTEGFYDTALNEGYGPNKCGPGRAALNL